MTVDQEIKELELSIKELNAKLAQKIIVKGLLDNVEKMIASQSGAIITADSSAMMSACAQLRALLLARSADPLKS
jgi:hypothetical protein